MIQALDSPMILCFYLQTINITALTVQTPDIPLGRHYRRTLTIDMTTQAKDEGHPMSLLKLEINRIVTYKVIINIQ